MRIQDPSKSKSARESAPTPAVGAEHLLRPLPLAALPRDPLGAQRVEQQQLVARVRAAAAPLRVPPLAPLLRRGAQHVSMRVRR